MSSFVPGCSVMRFGHARHIFPSSRNESSWLRLPGQPSKGPCFTHPLKWLGPVVFYKTNPGTPGRFFSGPRGKVQSALPRSSGGKLGNSGEPGFC